MKDPDREALDHTTLTNLLTWMLKELHGDIVQRFNSTPSMQRLEGQLNPVSTFHLEISLRGQTSLEMLRGLRQADIECNRKSDRCLDQKGQTATVSLGEAAGPDHLSTVARCKDATICAAGLACLACHQASRR